MPETKPELKPTPRTDHYYVHEDGIPGDSRLKNIPPAKTGQTQPLENPATTKKKTVNNLPSYISHPTATRAWFIEDRD